MKNGYTLIELMVVLMISVMVSLAIFTLTTVWANIFKSKDLDRGKLQVISFIYYSQNYCRANQKTACINFDTNNFKIILTCESKKISEITVSNKIQYRINKKVENYAEISNLGMIKNEGEIEIEYGKSKVAKIFLGAGGVYFEE